MHPLLLLNFRNLLLLLLVRRAELSFSVISTNAVSFPLNDLPSSIGSHTSFVVACALPMLFVVVAAPLCIPYDRCFVCLDASAAGLGFGFMHSLLFYGTVISSAWGPGTLFSPLCSEISVFVLSGSVGSFSVLPSDVGSVVSAMLL